MEEFESRLYFYPSDEVIKITKNQLVPELNNVVEGFEKDFFGIALIKEDSLEEYMLIYVGHYDKLEGIALKTGRSIKDRDTMTLKFSKVIEQSFVQNNQLVIFNTFQSKLMQLYESFGVLCISKYIANLRNPSIILPSNKKSIDYLYLIDILNIYRDFFKREKLSHNIDGEEKVYLMYDRKEDKIKIGKTRKKLETRRKGVAEPTKRAKDPMIELLVAWKASNRLEHELHKHYNTKRIRGEWFDLRASDLKEINIITQKQEMIDFKTK